jgi:hypothetical protein
MRALLAILLAAGLAVASAASAEGPRRAAVPEVWATVNVCDTESRPNQIGIRGGMEGLARRSRMYMRFRVQYQTLTGEWRTVTSGADSRWHKVATGRRGEYDAGWTFEFKPPATGGAHILRGVVRFEWRRGGRVLERDRAVTEAGHPGTAGADPADFSAATCAIA